MWEYMGWNRQNLSLFPTLLIRPTELIIISYKVSKTLKFQRLFGVPETSYHYFRQ